MTNTSIRLGIDRRIYTFRAIAKMYYPTVDEATAPKVCVNKFPLCGQYTHSLPSPTLPYVHLVDKLYPKSRISP